MIFKFSSTTIFKAILVVLLYTFGKYDIFIIMYYKNIKFIIYSHICVGTCIISMTTSILLHYFLYLNLYNSMHLYIHIYIYTHD